MLGIVRKKELLSVEYILQEKIHGEVSSVTKPPSSTISAEEDGFISKIPSNDGIGANHKTERCTEIILTFLLNRVAAHAAASLSSRSAFMAR